MNPHVFNGRQCKNIKNWHKLYNRCKSFVVIDSKCLGETSCHKSSLVTFDFTISPMFDFEHPFARNGLPTLGKWHQGSSVVDNKRVVLFLHGNLPLLCIFTLQCFFHGLKRLWLMHPQAPWWTQLRVQRWITEGKGVRARSLARSTSGVEGCVGAPEWD